MPEVSQRSSLRLFVEEKSVMTDDISYGLGMVLIQADETGRWCPMSFSSRDVRNSEKNIHPPRNSTWQSCMPYKMAALSAWIIFHDSERPLGNEVVA